LQQCGSNLQAFIVDGTGIEPWIIIAVVMFSTHGLPAINGLALQYIPTLPTIHSSVLWASQEVFEHYFLPFRASVQSMLLLLILVGLYFISVLLCFLFGLGIIERMLTQASQEIRWDNRIFGYVLCLVLAHSGLVGYLRAFDVWVSFPALALSPVLHVWIPERRNVVGCCPSHWDGAVL
jgi:hypothetical protein